MVLSKTLFYKKSWAVQNTFVFYIFVFQIQIWYEISYNKPASSFSFVDQTKINKNCYNTKIGREYAEFRKRISPSFLFFEKQNKRNQ